MATADTYHKLKCPKCEIKLIIQKMLVTDGYVLCPLCLQHIPIGRPNWIGKEYQRTDIPPIPYSGSDNIHYKSGCPALMSDGRFLTYHNSSKELTNALQRKLGISNSNDFRVFMQKYGDMLMLADLNHTIKNNTCNPRTTCGISWLDWLNHVNNF